MVASGPEALFGASMTLTGLYSTGRREVIEKALGVNVRAAIEVADRSEGKATQPVAGGYDGPIPMVGQVLLWKKGLGGEEIEAEEDPDKFPA